MKAIVTIKTTGKTFECRAERKNGVWYFGGDVADFENCHYVVFSKGIEYTCKNGRLIRA